MTKEQKGLIILIPAMVLITWFIGSVGYNSFESENLFFLLLIIIFLLFNLLFAFLFSSDKKNIPNVFAKYTLISFSSTMLIAFVVVIAWLFHGKIGG